MSDRVYHTLTDIITEIESLSAGIWVYDFKRVDLNVQENFSLEWIPQEDLLHG